MTDKKPPENRRDWSPPDNWQEEYSQLSEDFRHWVSMGWQATVAVLVADGVVASFAKDLAAHGMLIWVFVTAGVLSLLMAYASVKWTYRGRQRAKRLHDYDSHFHFERFYPQESWWLRLPLGYGLAGLVIITGIALIVIPFLAGYFPNLVFECIDKISMENGIQYTRSCR